MRVYLDSCIVIYGVECPREQGALIIRELESLNSIDEVFISDLVWLECMVDPLRQSDTERAGAMREALSVFSVLPMDAPVFRLATDLRATHGLKTPDAMHAACAITHGCDEFWTNDDKLARVVDQIKTRRIG